ncbi:MAG: hypothetical protein B6242_09890 [Anaerolineaceae bacterium 4572_78]|nr:MAG: hypothetical protein B6242_09890 [Anaerolineaceae bacterium 4572_78]
MKLIRFILILFIVGLLFGMTATGYAQSLEFKFHHLALEQDLSQSTVYAVLQDSRGFMWFGTDNGLSRFDGYDFITYRNDHADPHSVGANFISTIFEDSQGELWFGVFGGGLSHFDCKTEKFTNYLPDPDDSNSLSNDSVQVIYEDKHGIFWLGTFGGGLNRFDRETGTFDHYQHDLNDETSISDDIVWTIYQDENDIFWIGTWHGLNRFDPETGIFKQYLHDPNNPNSLSNDGILSFYADDDGRFWLGTSGGGVNVFEPKTEIFSYYQHDPDNPNSLSNDKVWVIMKDQFGIFWFGTDEGLNRFDSETEAFTRYYHDSSDEHSLSNNGIHAMSPTYALNEAGEWVKTSLYWIGTIGGLNTFDISGEQFVHYRHKNDSPHSLSNNDVKSIYQTEDGTVWVGTFGGGLNRLHQETGTFSHYRHDSNNSNSLSDDFVSSIVADEHGNLWIGTRNGGLNYFDIKTEMFTHYLHDPDDPTSLGIGEISSLAMRDGILWVGGEGVLNRFDIKTEIFTSYATDSNDVNKLSDDWINTLYVNSDGMVWIGTQNKGLNRLDPITDEIRHYWHEVRHYWHDTNDTNNLSNDTVFSIYGNDKSKILWIGTGGGLNKFDQYTEIFKEYRDNNGLANDAIYGIVSDLNGNLWLSTNHGLSRFDFRTFKNYNKDDGLQSDEFQHGSYYQGQDDWLFFGGLNGFNAFQPDMIHDNSYIPPVYITNFKLKNGASKFALTVKASLDPPNEPGASKFALTHQENAFTFEFTALNYNQPHKNQFAYKMDGFDKEWQYTTADRRFASYNNLDPGEYTFRVKASNNDNKWNENGTSLDIIITPPWWEMMLFRISVISFVLTLVFGGYRWRVHAVESQNRKLEQLVTQRTEELEYQAEILEQQTAELEVQAIELHNAKETAEHASEIANSLRHVATILNKSLDVEVVLDKIIGQLSNVLDSDSGSLFLKEDNNLILKIASENIRHFVDTCISISDHNTGVAWVYMQQQVIIIDDVTQDTRWQVWEGDEPIRSWMGAPLIVADEVIGVLTTDSHHINSYTKDDARVLQMFANQAAQAIKNAHLYSLTQNVNEELKKINADKDRFFSIVAHDLKNPFLPLLGMAELLPMIADSAERTELKQMSEVIHHSAQSVYNLLVNLLDWARMQGGRMPFEPKRFKLNDVVQNNITLLEENAKSKGITLSHSMTDDIFVHADRNMLDAVIRNLISNALKFTPSGGSVEVGLESHELGSRIQSLDSKILTSNSLIEIHVKDSGIGISEADIDKLFRIDVHHTTTGTDQESGTGLGLIMCHEMVNQNGGKIWVESEIGKGTTVKFTVPLFPL